jgi:hypothetical protein
MASFTPLPHYNQTTDAGWTPELVSTMCTAEKFLTLAGHQTPGVQPVVRCYTA